MKPEELIEALNTEIGKLNEQPIDEFSGDTLSRIGVRLSSYKAGLGKHVSEAKAEAWRAEKALAEAKANGYQQMRNDGVSQGDAKETRITLVAEQYSDWIEKKKIEDQLVGLSFNISDVIDSIKSRLIHLQMELKESTHFG